ncbi:MAG: class I SAM-dependent methyltransferase [Ktedonobacteraceae bacterium]|nr:class I SAM-dependent methyltransferase [Ktedonobacteraceae bacterium]
MSTSPESRREQPSTYFVQDRANKDEIKRLQVQDQMITASMGGVLPEQPDPTTFQRVLDVGCGTGGWLIEVAKTYPNVVRAVGIDISGKMVEYARSQAQTQEVAERVEFHVMDALRPLEFPADSFDLVNMRFGLSYLRKWDWPNVLSEFYRIARPGGVARLTESGLTAECNSPALIRLCQMLLQALYQAGQSFTPRGDGVTSQLEGLLRQFGLQDVQTRSYESEYHAGTVEGQRYYEDMKHAYSTLQPFLRKWTQVPNDYEQIYQQALIEIQRPGFVAKWSLLTAWGTIPENKQRTMSTMQPD